jgi:hypothetical protein
MHCVSTLLRCDFAMAYELLDVWLVFQDNLNVVKIVDLSTGVVVGEHALPGETETANTTATATTTTTTTATTTTMNEPFQLC